MCLLLFLNLWMNDWTYLPEWFWDPTRINRSHSRVVAFSFIVIQIQFLFPWKSHGNPIPMKTPILVAFSFIVIQIQFLFPWKSHGNPIPMKTPIPVHTSNKHWVYSNIGNSARGAECRDHHIHKLKLVMRYW